MNGRDKFFYWVKTIFWRWIVIKISLTVVSIFLLIYIALLFDNEYIAAICVTASEKAFGKDAELTHYLKERTHRDLYSPLNLLQVESEDNTKKEGTLHFVIKDAKVDPETIFAVQKLRESHLSKDEKKYLTDLNLALQNFRFKVLNGVYTNHKKDAMLELQKIINVYAAKKHSCLDHNSTITFIHQPIFQLAKNIVVYSEELSTAKYEAEIEKYNKDQSIDINTLPIVQASYIPSLILSNTIIGTCTEH